MTAPKATKAKEKAPKHLRAATGRWYVGVCSDYILEPHHRMLLLTAAEAWDRKSKAVEILTKDGLTVPDRNGVAKCHPAIAIERDSSNRFARLLRELALDLDPPPESRRPPTHYA